MKNNTTDNIDDDIVTETRSEKSSKPIVRLKPKWTGSDVILPIKDNNITVMKRIEDTTVEEFSTWLLQVMPFTQEEVNTYVKRGVNSTREKIGLFETAVLLHAKRWLFGLGEPERSDLSIRWS